MSFTLSINGRTRSVDVEPGMPLLWVLRDELGILGPKYGCGAGICGACTVQIDGQPRRACITPVSTVGQSKVTTIEGLGATATGRLAQTAWKRFDVAQCGYCQPGQITAAAALLASVKAPTDADIDQAMGGHLCRCATYLRIREAIKWAAAQQAGVSA